MSGGTPFQYAVLFTVIGLVVAVVVARATVGRARRARATGAVEAESVRSRAHASEIADRLFSYSSDMSSDGGDAPPRIWIRGAARLFQLLSADDRFDVTPRDRNGDYWSFVVRAPEGGPADGDALAHKITEILAKNGVTATRDPGSSGE